MSNPVIVVHYHELWLKGGNRRFFLGKLHTALRQSLQGIPVERIEQPGDRYADDKTAYKRLERRLSWRSSHVDVVADGDALPFDDDSYDFVFSSHVIEHFPDPIKALHEWVRVARRYVVAVVPHRDRTFDSDRPLTTVDELVHRHQENFSSEGTCIGVSGQGRALSRCARRSGCAS